MSNQSRAPAPRFSPQHFALARSLPHSKASTPTPSLLTPPVSGTPNMSPPPRHEAGDYMNVHDPDYHHHKRRLSKKKTRKLYNTRAESEGSRPQQRSLRSGPQKARSNGSDCELCAAGFSDDDEDNHSDAPLIRSLGQPGIQDHPHGPHVTTEVDGGHVPTWPTLSSSFVAADESDSPAVNALRSFSFQKPVPSNPPGLRRVSTAFTNTLNYLKLDQAVSFAAAPSHKAGKKTEEVSRRSSAHSKSLAYGDINRRRQASKDGNGVFRTLGTPATITLRKASNVYATSPITTSMTASLICEPEHERAADAPTSELLAFYSSPTLEKGPTSTNLPSPESTEVPSSLKEQSRLVLEMCSQPLRRESKSVSQFIDISNARRCSMPAEAALTFTDVHVAPGSFAVGPKSSKQALLSTEFSRRISTVQFRSRNSVHEVIWREDETTSDCSLTASSGASQHVGHSFRSTPSPESEGSPAQEPAIEAMETKIALPMVSDSVSMFTKLPNNLFHWNWGASSAAAEGLPRAVDPKSDHQSQTAEPTARAADAKGDPLGHVMVISTSGPGFAGPLQSSDQEGLRSQEPSISKLSNVQSFPPLRPRSSTAEWQKAPLVDLNDPLAGRVIQHQARKSTHSIRLGTDVDSSFTGVSEQQSPQLHGVAGGMRWSSSQQANARLGSMISPGSGIGASSREKIMLRHKV